MRCRENKCKTYFFFELSILKLTLGGTLNPNDFATLVKSSALTLKIFFKLKDAYA